MAVHVRDHVPAVGFETLRGVVVEPVHDVAVDRDAVVVVQRDQLVQLQRAGERAGFVRDAFHQAAVAEEHVRVVIDDLRAVTVELVGHQRFAERHADRVRETLAERAGGRLDARRDAVFRVARRLRVQLAEVLQLFDRQVVAGQVQQRVQQHRAMAVRQHEAVAVCPVRVRRVVLQMARPERDADFGHAHRHAGVAGVRLLDGVHCERTDRIGHQGGGGGRRSRHVESGERVEETGHGGIRKLERQSFPARGAAPDGREADGAYGRGCKARHFNRWADISLVGE